MPADALPPQVEIIDYAYSSNGTFYHGTVSNLGGKPKSTWTVSKGEQKQTFDEPIDQVTFTYLVTGISSLEVFSRTFVSDPNTKLDFYHFQIIGFVSTEDGKMKIRSYMIAPTETDLKYKDWIAKLQVPLEKTGP